AGRVGTGHGGSYAPPYNVGHSLHRHRKVWGGHFNGLGHDFLAAGGPSCMGWHNIAPVNYEHREDLQRPPFVPIDAQAYIRQYLRLCGYEVLDPFEFDANGHLSVRLSGGEKAVCP